MLNRVLLLAAVLALGACTLPATPPGASLPPDAVVGAGDPLRSAVSNTSVAFSGPGRLAGHPAEAARALAQMEYLAAEMPANPRLTGVSPTVLSQMQMARVEWRAALGIAPGAEPQPVIDSLYAAARALGAGQPAAAAAVLPPTIFPAGGDAVLTRLATLPQLPLTNQAAVGATDAIRQREMSPGTRL